MICDRVLFVDDDAHVRAANVQALELEGLAATACSGARQAFAALSRDFPGVVVSDLRMPGEDGHALFRRIRALDPELPVLLITGHADIAEAVQALHDGAFDFLAKPYAPDRLLVSVRRALAMRTLVLENRRLRAQAAQGARTEDEALWGDAPAMRSLREAVRRIADAGGDVVIEGETGTGKEAIARALHRLSRRGGRFVVVDCGELTDEGGERELFGSPSGGGRSRPGRLEAAHGGTLFLREADRLPPRLQGRLLRALEAGAVGAEDGDGARPVDVRVAAAVHAPLRAQVEAGLFRADLFHRLDGPPLRAPPLRERREDLPLLFGRLLSDASRRLRAPTPALIAAVRSRLETHGWPGNFRELKSYADRVALGLPEAADVPGESLAGGLGDRVAAFEAELLREALQRAEGSVSRALEVVKLPRKTFYDKLAKHGLRPERFRRPRRDGEDGG